MLLSGSLRFVRSGEEAEVSDAMMKEAVRVSLHLKY